MATKIIKAWINGAVQNIEVEDIVSPAQPLSVDERVEKLEDKHEVVITDGNLLVGNGTTELEELTPEEVLSHINGASVETMTTSEYNHLKEYEINANTLYVLTDIEDPEYALRSDFESLQTEVSQKSQVQIVTSTDMESVTENLSTLQIHKLTEEQYQQMLESGIVDENALYLTPDEEVDLSEYATKDELTTKADVSHNHDSSYDAYGSANTALSNAKSYTDSKITEWVGDTAVSAQISTAITNKADSAHNHDSSYDMKGSADTALESAKIYTDNAVAQKTYVQIITWEVDD